MKSNGISRSSPVENVRVPYRVNVVFVFHQNIIHKGSYLFAVKLFEYPVLFVKVKHSASLMLPNKYHLIYFQRNDIVISS